VLPDALWCVRTIFILFFSFTYTLLQVLPDALRCVQEVKQIQGSVQERLEVLGTICICIYIYCIHSLEVLGTAPAHAFVDMCVQMLHTFMLIQREREGRQQCEEA
jgi:hypothetical protein